MAKLRAFRLAAAIVPYIPLWLAYPGARLIGMLIWAFGGALRRRVERNLRHIPALASDPVALSRAARGVFEHMVLNYLDFLRGPHLTDKQVLAGWTTEGEELISAFIQQGRGLIVVSAHFGNFEYGASRLGAEGFRMTTPVERMQPEALYNWFCKTREHHNLHVLPADTRETLRQMMSALKRNEVVLIAADRHIVGSSIEVPFFGEPARLPTSAVALALKMGAPIVASFSWRLGRGRSRGVVIPLNMRTASADAPGAVNADNGGNADAATRVRSEEATARAVRNYVGQLERLITAHPEQWVSTLAPIWDEEETETSERGVSGTQDAGHSGTEPVPRESPSVQPAGQPVKQSAIQSA